MRHARIIASWSFSSRFTICGRSVHSCTGHGCIASIGFGFGRSGCGAGGVPHADKIEADTITRTWRTWHLRFLHEFVGRGHAELQAVEPLVDAVEPKEQRAPVLFGFGDVLGDR